MHSSARVRLLLLAVLLLPLGGCLFRSHPVQSRISTALLKNATKEELIERINSQAAKIKTLNATVDISTSVGGQRQGKVVEYAEIRGYILVRKPDMLRMIGLFPVVRNRAFEMASTGNSFKLWIPVKNRFVIGRNDIVYPSKQPLENLRPQQIFDALLLREIDPRNEIAVLENSTEPSVEPKTNRPIDQPVYVLIVIRRADGDWYLSRKIFFDRSDLEPHRQVVYDKNGYIASDVHYDNFADYSGVHFPTDIRIWRPQEEYTIGLHIVKFQINQPLTDEQFALNQSPGAQVVRLDVPPNQANASDGSKAPNNGSNQQRPQ
jgi:outer membrane lipoprotein-sorting protein